MGKRAALQLAVFLTLYFTVIFAAPILPLFYPAFMMSPVRIAGDVRAQSASFALHSFSLLALGRFG